jgi:predicted DNA-binding transcriptional regulator YafY
MLDTSARLLRLLTLLQARREWSGAELSTRLEISERTLRRDMDRLRTLGYPVASTTGTAGGYRLEPGAAMPPLLLDDDEAVAVAISLRTAAGGIVTGIEEVSLQALAKLEQILPSRLRHRVQAIQAATAPGPAPAWGTPIDADLLMTLAGACRDRTELRFDYRSRPGDLTRRTVEPHRLVPLNRRWYLLAWDTSRRDWRTLRVDRIDSTPLTGARFAERPLPDDDPARWVAAGVSSQAYRYAARVTLHAPAAEMAARVGAGTGTVRALDERSCELVTGADTLAGLAFLLANIGPDFTVHEPVELRQHLASMGDRLTRAAAMAE